MPLMVKKLFTNFWKKFPNRMRNTLPGTRLTSKAGNRISHYFAAK